MFPSFMMCLLLFMAQHSLAFRNPVPVSSPASKELQRHAHRTLLASSVLQPYQQCGGKSGSDCTLVTGLLNLVTSLVGVKLCGDKPYDGWTCPTGFTCVRSNAYYWQCLSLNVGVQVGTSVSANSSPSPSPSPSPLPSLSPSPSPSPLPSLSPSPSPSSSPSQSPSPSQSTTSTLYDKWQCGGTGFGCVDNSDKPCVDAAWRTCDDGYQCSRLSDTLWWCKNDTATIKDPIDQASDSGSSAGNSASAGGDTSDITNNTPTYSTPTAPDECTTIFGTGGSSSSWWPLTLRQLVEDLAAAEMPVSEPLFQGSGSFGAVVTVNKNSTQAWHVQLSSVPFPMVAGHYYTLKYGVMSSVPAFTQVALVEDKSWELFHLSQPQTTPTFSLRTTINLATPKTSTYLLNIDLGLAEPRTEFKFDDLLLCERVDGALPTGSFNGSLPVAASSSKFSSFNEVFTPQIVAPAEATVDMQGIDSEFSDGRGAVISVIQQGREPWHIQLLGQPIRLNASATYIVQLTVKQSAGSNLASNWFRVTWIGAETYVAASVNTVLPTTSLVTHTLPTMSPPRSGQYYLTIDCGWMATGTTLYIDDVSVFEA